MELVHQAQARHAPYMRKIGAGRGKRSISRSRTSKLLDRFRANRLAPPAPAA
jgi:hypothetical protein